MTYDIILWLENTERHYNTCRSHALTAIAMYPDSEHDQCVYLETILHYEFVGNMESYLNLSEFKDVLLAQALQSLSWYDIARHFILDVTND